MLTDVINYKRSYLELPNLYKGLASHDTIKKAMSQGKFFYSMTPDLYSAVALAHVLDTYYYSFKPYAINGASHHSIGTSSFSASSELKHQQYANKFISEDNIPFHNKLVIVPSIPILVAETFLQAQDNHVAKPFKIDMKKVLQCAVKEAKHYPDDKYKKIIEAVKKIAIRNHLEHEISEIISTYKQEISRVSKPVLGFNLVRGSILLDCTDFGIRNVYDASVLCKHVMELEKLGYFSIKGIIKTTLGFIKREFLKRFTLK
jgi:hypothetical protein